MLATVSVSCYVTNYAKLESEEIISDTHLGLFIYLRHCDRLHRIFSLDLLATTVFDALNALNSFSDLNFLLVAQIYKELTLFMMVVQVVIAQAKVNHRMRYRSESDIHFNLVRIIC